MTLQVGLVGFGVAGRQHADALKDAGFARIRSVLDADPALDTGPLPRAQSWEALLADPEVDLIALCTPPGGRARLAEQALAAGKAVLLEKPPAVSVAELDALVALADAQGLPVGVMLQHRHRLPDRITDLDWTAAASGVLQVSRFRPPAHYRRVGWRHDPAASLGGITAHLGVHYLDLACQLLGEPSGVHLAGRREHIAGIDSRIAGVVEFTGGGLLSFVVTAESTVRTERLEILGAERRFLIQDGAVTVETAGGAAEDLPGRPTWELRREVYRELAGAVATGTEPPRCSLRRARGITAVLEQVAVWQPLAVAA